MPHKISLAVASLAATLTFALALALAGLAPAASAAATANTSTADPVASADPPAVQVDTVYVAAPAKQEVITVHKVVKTSGEDDSEHESGGND